LSEWADRNCGKNDFAPGKEVTISVKESQPVQQEPYKGVRKQELRDQFRKAAKSQMK